MTRTCRACGKTIEVGYDLYYQIDLSFKDPYGMNIFTGASDENHAAFCSTEACAKKAADFLKHLQGIFIHTSV